MIECIKNRHHHKREAMSSIVDLQAIILVEENYDNNTKSTITNIQMLYIESKEEED